jgi:hypothetical protein
MALFGFASAAISTLECSAFAAYCVGSLARPDVFPTNADSDLKFYPAQVRDTYLRTYPQEAVGVVLDEILRSATYVKLADLRNVLSHRGTLPRAFRVSVGSARSDGDGAFIPSNPKSISTNWQIDQRLDHSLTDSMRGWLGQVHARLLQAIAGYATRNL